MLEPDTDKTDKVENSSLGITEGAEDQTFASQPLTRDFQPSAAQKLAVSHIQQLQGWGFSSVCSFQAWRGKKTLNGKVSDVRNHLPS